MKDCQWYEETKKGELGFCCKDLDSGRCWDCTCQDKKKRSKQSGINCPYPKIDKE